MNNKMHSQEQLQELNMTEQVKEPQSILNYYTSQRADILSQMNVEKQREEQTKQYLDVQKTLLKEKIYTCQELQRANELMNENLVKDQEQRNNLVNILTSTNEIMNNHVECFNLLQKLMELCINGQQNADARTQEVAVIFEEFRQNDYIIEDKFVGKLNNVKEYLKNLKQEQIQLTEHQNILINKDIETIFEKKQNIIQLREQITSVDTYNLRLSEELNDVEKANSDLSSECLDFKKNCEDIMKQNETEEESYKKTMSAAQLQITSLNEEKLRVENEFKELQKVVDCKDEFLKILENQALTAEVTLSNSKIKCNEIKKEVQNMEEQLQNKTKCFDEKKIELKKQIEEIEEKIKNVAEDKTVLEQEYSAFEIEHNDKNNQINNIEMDITKYESEIKEKETIQTEQSEKFKTEIIALEKILSEKSQTEISLQKQKEDHDAKEKELDEQIEESSIKMKKGSAAAEEEEVTLNISIDTIRDEIIKEKYETEKLQTHTSKYKSEQQDKLQIVKQTYELKIEKLDEEFNISKLNLNDQYKFDEKQNSNEYKKLKEKNQTIELQASELKVSTESLQNELNLKIKELEQINQQLREITENQNSEDHTKRSSSNFKIPDLKIPHTMYSSTSDSGDEKPLIKRRRVTFKRKAELQESQKSVDDIFEALKSGNEIKSGPGRKRNNKKPVF